MNEILIDRDKALELLRAKIAGNEEYVDPFGTTGSSCQYTPDPEMYSGVDKNYTAVYIDYPGCLIGQICHDLGATLDQLRTMDTLGTVPVVVEEGEFPFSITNSAAEVFFVAQKAQDQGKPWGDALRDAETEYARIEDE